MRKASFVVFCIAMFVAGVILGEHGIITAEAEKLEESEESEENEGNEGSKNNKEETLIELLDSKELPDEVMEEENVLEAQEEPEEEGALEALETPEDETALEALVTPEEEVVLEVPEEPQGSYTIRFHEDFDDGNDRSFTQTVPFGETAVLSECPWSHDGYRFAGWFASGYGVNHALANVYAAGAPVLDLGLEDGDLIEVYAGWCRNEEDN